MGRSRNHPVPTKDPLTTEKICRIRRKESRTFKIMRKQTVMLCSRRRRTTSIAPKKARAISEAVRIRRIISSRMGSSIRGSRFLDHARAIRRRYIHSHRLTATKTITLPTILMIKMMCLGAVPMLMMIMSQRYRRMSQPTKTSPPSNANKKSM